MQIPKSCFKWLDVKEGTDFANQDQNWLPYDQPPSARRSYSASPGIIREFCATCGGFLTWIKDDGFLDVSVGTIDPLFLVGPSDDPEVGKADVDGQQVPEGGYGLVLAGGYGNHYFCSNEIRGVTSEFVTVGAGGRGKRHPLG